MNSKVSRREDDELLRVPEGKVGFVTYFLDLLAWGNIKAPQSEKLRSKSLKGARVILHDRTPCLEISVHAVQDAVVKIDASVNGDLGGNRNILVTLSGDGLDEGEMTALGYIKSWVGYYRYLKNNIDDGKLVAVVKICPRVDTLKIMAWNFDGPLVLDDITVQSSDSELSSKMLDVDSRDNSREVEITRESYIRANLMLNKHRCGPDCIVHCQKWFNSMDAFADRHGIEIYGRRSVFIEAPSGELLPASIQKARPAFLKVPESIESYLASIGDKSRNMVRKAQRMGYEYLPIGPEGLDQDILDVRTSDPMRQGRPIPGYYYSNPPLYVLKPSPVGCEYHTERFYGIFKDGRLVSYITLFMFGGFAQINHILCHKDHVKNGVMNMNVFHVVGEMIRRQPWVRAINYLYVADQGGGIDMFKRSVGFMPEGFAVYDSEIEAPKAHDGEVELTHEISTEVVAKSVGKSRKKLTKRDFFKKTIDRLALAPEISASFGDDVHAFQDVREKDFIDFISSGLNRMAAEHVEGTIFAIPFPANVQEGRYPEVANYLTKRFKGNPIPDIGFSQGFKGGNFRALAFYLIEDETDRLFNGILILEKLS